MSTLITQELFGVGNIPVAAEYTSQEVQDKFNQYVTNIQTAFNKSPTFTNTDATTVTTNMQNLLSLAKDGLPVEPNLSNSPRDYLTTEMADIVNQLTASLITVGIQITPTTSNLTTAAQLTTWHASAISSFPEIITRAGAAIQDNRSLQALIELEYISTGNQIISAQMLKVEDSLTATQASLNLLNQLQSLHNQMVAPDPKDIASIANLTLGAPDQLGELGVPALYSQRYGPQAFNTQLIPSALISGSSTATGGGLPPDILVQLRQLENIRIGMGDQLAALQRANFIDPTDPTFPGSLQGTLQKAMDDIDSYIGKPPYDSDLVPSVGNFPTIFNEPINVKAAAFDSSHLHPDVYINPASNPTSPTITVDTSVTLPIHPVDIWATYYKDFLQIPHDHSLAPTVVASYNGRYNMKNGAYSVDSWVHDPTDPNGQGLVPSRVDIIIRSTDGTNKLTGYYRYKTDATQTFFPDLNPPDGLLDLVGSNNAIIVAYNRDGNRQTISTNDCVWVPFNPVRIPALPGAATTDVGYPIPLPGISGFGELAVPFSRQSVFGWIMDYQDVQVSTTKNGQVQQNLDAGITAAQSLNTTTTQKLQGYMFVFQQYYQSAATMLSSITQIIQKFAQGISGG